MKEVQRDLYLNQLIEKQWNGQVKIITGLRRAGKSYLLFTLFVRYLVEHDVPQDHIITLALDDFKNRQYRQADALYDYVTKRIVDSERYYVLLDEIQKAEDFVDVLNGFLHIPNIDVYVTGSNSKFLSSDIATEFGDRGDEINVHPLSFSEFYSVYDGDKHHAWNEYCRYGGMPLVLQRTTDAAKQQYLKDLFRKVYLKDIIARYNLRADNDLANVTDIVASDIGSLLNPLRIANTIKTAKNKSVSQNTIEKYLDYLQDSFLIEQAVRYDIKGRKYITTPQKYYFTDIGLRNARINFRQQEENHIMENVIYNELLIRGFAVDVGVVEVNVSENGKPTRKQLEVDFVANKGSLRYYIQSAWDLPNREKIEQEQQSFVAIGDSFKKILIQKNDVLPWYNEQGILVIGLLDFLLHPECIEK
ncbi:MAG: ATP-binding protein [Paludibacteraceae bacterium]|nr:ATP-binding protein [Paludibacteraceae bacterium]